MFQCYVPAMVQNTEAKIKTEIIKTQILRALYASAITEAFVYTILKENMDEIRAE